MMLQKPHSRFLSPTPSGETATKSRIPAPLRWVGSAVTVVIFWLVMLVAIVLIVVPVVTGSQTYAVLTNSMSPAYPPGTLLVVKPTDFDTLQRGDVVTYQLESGRPEVITHRVVSFSVDQEGNRLLLTQGDNNDVADENPVMELQVRGKLFYAVPYAGFIANALGQTDRSHAITFVAVALILYGGITICRGTHPKKNKNQTSKTEETVA